MMLRFSKQEGDFGSPAAASRFDTVGVKTQEQPLVLSLSKDEAARRR